LPVIIKSDSYVHSGDCCKLANVRAQIEKQIIATIQSSKVNSESEVRKTNAHIARTLRDKALAVIDKRKPEDLTFKQAIEMIKFAMPEERKALGLPDKYEFTSAPEDNNQKFMSVEERKEKIHHSEILAEKLFAYLNSK
jgi:hypothetical protein